MDFNKTINNDLAEKYKEMLSGKAECSFSGNDIKSANEYGKKVNAYKNRLNKEKKEFNDALRLIRKRKDAREAEELRAKRDILEKKAKKKHSKFIFASVIIFLFPIFFAAVVGIDLFSPVSGRELSNFAGAVTGYVFLCIAMFLLSLSLFRKVLFRVKYVNRNEIRYKKKCKRTAIAIFVVFVGMAVLNLALYITFGVGDVKTFDSRVSDFKDLNTTDYSNYDEYLSETVDAYDDMAFWQKWLISDKEYTDELIEGYCEYKVKDLRFYLENITPEEGYSSGYLEKISNIYSSLNKTYIKYMEKEETIACENFVKVYDVINKINELNQNVVDNYNSIQSIKELYNSLDDYYKAFVVNYDLIESSEDSYQFLSKLNFESVSGGYMVSLKDGETLSGKLAIPAYYKGSPVVEIAEAGFENMSDITEIIVPDTVTEIGFGAFCGCNRLQSITLPFVGYKIDTDTDRWRAFGYIFGDYENHDQDMEYSSTILKTSEGRYTSQVSTSGGKYYYYLIPSSLRNVIITQQTSVPDNAFNNCDLIKSVVFDKGIQTVGENAFRNCSALSNVDLSNTIEIGMNAFYNCNSFSELNFSESLTTIKGNAFACCTGLRDVVVPDSVTFIGSGAFGDCDNLESITLPFIGREMNTTTSRWSVFGYIFGDGGYTDDNMDYSSTIYKTSSGKYTSQIIYTGSSYFYFKIPMTLKSVTITKQTKVPDYAFNNCDLIESITFMKELEEIGDYAFKDCNALTDLNFRNGYKATGQYAFMNCTSLKNAPIPYNTTSISLGAFYGCTGFTSVTIPDHIQEIGYSAFYGADNITDLTLPFIGRSLSETTSARVVLGYIFGDGTDTMSSSSTIYKTSGGQYTSQVKRSSSTGYYYYKIPMSLKNITVTKQQEIPSNAFYNCDLLENITFVQSITYEGSNAFYNCTATVNKG